MDLSSAQSELREAYVHGGPGTLISGLIWLIAAITGASSNVATGFTVLFFGGMLIFPASKIVILLCFRRKPESKKNPGGLIVIETIFPMIGGLFAAWLILPYRPEFVFSLAAIAVGAHYWTFAKSGQSEFLDDLITGPGEFGCLPYSPCECAT